MVGVVVKRLLRPFGARNDGCDAVCSGEDVLS